MAICAIVIFANQAPSPLHADGAEINNQNTKAAKHCMTLVEVTHRQVFMREPWRLRAKNKAWAVWQASVTKRFGSAYQERSAALVKDAKCERVGFGQDAVGNVGTYVSCTLSAIPCVNLISPPATKQR